MDNTRREEFACPSCGKAPPVGACWTCQRCSRRLDLFKERAVCPKCGSNLLYLQCDECKQWHSFGDWFPEVRARRIADSVVGVESAKSAGRDEVSEVPRIEGPPNAARNYRKAIALLPPLSDSEVRILKAVLTTPLNQTTRRLIESSEQALLELRQGAMRELCDWELDSPKRLQGLIDLAVSVRRLCDFTCLRARQAFRDRDGWAALEGLADLLVLARHYGRAGTLIMRRMQSTIELVTTEIAALHLLEQDPAALRAFAVRLASLPEPVTLAETMEKEKQYLLYVLRPQFEGKSRQEGAALLRSWTFASNAEAILTAAGPEVMGLLNLIDNSAGLYDELGPILMLPVDRVRQALAEFVQRHQETNPLVVSDVRAINSMLYPVARGRVRVDMLQMAVAIAAEGNWREAVRDPTRTGPFQCRCFKTGFELKASSGFVDQPLIVLTVGKKQGLFGSFPDFLKRLIGQT